MHWAICHVTTLQPIGNQTQHDHIKSHKWRNELTLAYPARTPDCHIATMWRKQRPHTCGGSKGRSKQVSRPSLKQTGMTQTNRHDTNKQAWHKQTGMTQTNRRWLKQTSDGTNGCFLQGHKRWKKCFFCFCFCFALLSRYTWWWVLQKRKNEEKLNPRISFLFLLGWFLLYNEHVKQ